MEGPATDRTAPPSFSRVTEADRAAWRELTQARAQEAFQRGRDAGEAGDREAARRWLERARRISGGAVQVDVALALARLACGDAAGAITLLNQLLRRFDFREGWTALAAAHHALGDVEQAAQALHQALSRHAPDASLFATVTRITHGALWPGWCGLCGEGRLLINGADAFRQPTRHEIRLDGRAVKHRLPSFWREARVLEIRRGSAPLLGSPIAVDVILRTEGFVESAADGLHGWLWHPGEPERAPWVSILGGDGSRRRIRLKAFSERIESEAPLARPRRLFIAAADLPPGPIRLHGEDGRALMGSPVAPRPRAARRRRGAATSRPRNPGFDVVIPVYRHLRRTMDCIDGVRATVPAGCRVVVVEDASPEPALVHAMDRLAQAGAITLLRNGENRGFPVSANRGIAACAGRDVILLNSDTLVAPGWAEALRAALTSAADIGSATPFSNDASILSYPSTHDANTVPDQIETRRLMAFAAAANAGLPPVEIPTGNGFCMAIRRDCLDQTGLLREDLFAQGYGEENDFCLRARALGWRHVGAPGAYVGHVGAASFGPLGRALLRRNLDIINRLHPGYDALIQAHIAADPLAEARRRLDRVRFAAARHAAPRAALLITHADAGGVERVVRARAEALTGQGIRPIVLRPDGDACLIDAPPFETARAFPNLRYRLPDEMEALVALLQGEGLLHAEWHHWLGHAPALRGLCDRLAVSYDIYVHDYALFCERIALLGPARRYCGEPEITGCDACVAAQGSLLGEAIAPAALQARSSRELAAARAVIAPSEDAARRIARHFPGIRPRVSPWEDDAPDLPLARFAATGRNWPDTAAGQPKRARVGVIGAIGDEKGYEVLLDCLHDARARALALDFVVVGHTTDDEALFAAGCLDITGPYAHDEAVTLVHAQRCDLAFLPSIWPETWCFTLSVAWRAGLGAAVFDIGAQAERVRRTGRGAVLPLGLGIAALNDALHALCRARRNTMLSSGRSSALASGVEHERALRMAR